MNWSRGPNSAMLDGKKGRFNNGAFFC